MIQVKSQRELEKMQVAGRHVGEILLRLRELATPGITTAEFNRVATEEIQGRGVGPQAGFPDVHRRCLGNVRCSTFF